MTTPNLKEIFFKHDFTGDMIPELESSRNERFNALKKLENAHNISFSESDEIEGIIMDEAIAAQFMGVVQGFKWAVYLFTGHKDEKPTPIGEEAKA